jgi:hypothetical protein
MCAINTILESARSRATQAGEFAEVPIGEGAGYFECVLHMRLALPTLTPREPAALSSHAQAPQLVSPLSISRTRLSQYDSGAPETALRRSR